MMKMYFVLILLAAGFCHTVDASDIITLRISSGAVETASDETEALQIREQGKSGGGMVVLCKRMQTKCDEDTFSVTCDDIVFSTANGMNGTAKHAEFNLKSNRVVFTGEKDSPIAITLFASPHSQSIGETLNFLTDKIELNITPKRLLLPHERGILPGSVTSPNAPPSFLSPAKQPSVIQNQMGTTSANLK